MTNRIQGDWDDESWYGQVVIDGRPLDPKRSQKLRNHSPDGFAWGYAGSGPAQLALAILLEAGATDAQALAYYQDFKREFLATAPNQQALDIQVDLLDWLGDAEDKLWKRLGAQ